MKIWHCEVVASKTKAGTETSITAFGGVFATAWVIATLGAVAFAMVS